MDLGGRLIESVTIPPGYTRAQTLEQIAPYLGEIDQDETLVVVLYGYKLNGHHPDYAEEMEEIDVPLNFERIKLDPELEDTKESAD